MKKTILFSGMAVALLSLGACSNDIDEPAVPQDGNVHLKVQMPAGMKTRAFADGKKASTLTYAVYESGTKNLILKSEDQVSFDPTTLTAEVSLQLVNGRKYDVVFWADAPGQDFYTFNEETQSISVNYDGLTGNQENRDAFFGSTTLDVTAPINETVYLKRPFAQINLGTDDLANPAVTAAYKNGLNVKLVTKAYNSLNLLDGTVEGLADVTYAPAPSTDCTIYQFPFNPSTEPESVSPYSYIAMDYLLTEADKALVDCEFTFLNGTETMGNPLNVSNVPVQRNYRTNIYGSLLTSRANLTVEILPGFGGDDYNVPVTPVSTKEQLDAAITAGGNYNLTAPMDIVDLSSASPAKDLTLTLGAAVGKIKLGTSTPNTVSTTIVVPAGVEFPAFESTGGNSHINNITIKGDLSTSNPCKGFVMQGGVQFGGTTTKGVREIDGLTFENVVFEGAGINVGYTANPQTTKNITVKNCVFKNIKTAMLTCSNNLYEGTVVGDFTITGNKVTFAPDAASNSNGINIWYANTGRLTVTDNEIIGAPYHGIQLASSTVPVTITGNKIVNAKRDGIKTDSNSSTVVISGNNVKAEENGIRVKNFPASNNVTVENNTIDMSITKAYNEADGEPWGILIIQSGTTSSNPLITVKGNIKVGTSDHWFQLRGFTPAAGSEYSAPWAN